MESPLTKAKNRKIRKKSRPEWAYSERDIMHHLLDSNSISRRFEIACLYWLENRTAKEISQKLNTTTLSIKSTISKIRGIK